MPAPLHKSALAVLSAGWLAGSASQATAHGPTEVSQIMASAADDVLIATSRGLLFGTPAPRSWSLLCTEAMGLTSGQPYSVAVLTDGRLLLAGSGALRISDDGGCSFHTLPLSVGRATSFMAQDPRDPARIFLVVEGAVSATVYGGVDAGEQLRPLFELPEGAVVRSLLLAPTVPVRLYLSGFIEQPMGMREHFVAGSADGGEHWQTHQVALEQSELDLTLLAVDPTQPAQLLARASASTPSFGERVLWSRDQGASFRPIANVRVLRSAAFATEGGSAYLGGVDGVDGTHDLEGSFTPLGAARWVNFVTTRGDQLFVVGYYAGIEARLHGIGVARPPDAALQPWMSFNEVATLRACPSAPELARTCELALRDWLLDHPPYAFQAPGYVEASPRELLRPLSDGDAIRAPTRDAAPPDQVEEARGDAMVQTESVLDAGIEAVPTAEEAGTASSHAEQTTGTPVHDGGPPRASRGPHTGCAVQSATSPRESLWTWLFPLGLVRLLRSSRRARL